MCLNEDEISMKKFTLFNRNAEYCDKNSVDPQLHPLTSKTISISYNCVLVLQEMASIPPWQVEMQFIGTNATAGQ